jgi:hypothetical protein
VIRATLFRLLLISAIGFIGTLGTLGGVLISSIILGLLFQKNPVLPLVGFLLLFIVHTSNASVIPGKVVVSQLRFVFLALFASRAVFLEFPLLNSSARRIVIRFVIPVAIFALVAAFTSLAAGYHVLIALLKILQFLVLIFALSVFFARCQSRVDELHLWTFAVILFYVVSGWILLLAAPQIGYRYHEPTGMLLFQGVTSQPQGFAVLIGLSGTYLFVSFDVRDRIQRRVILLGVFAAIGLLWFTRSRTGMIGLFATTWLFYGLGLFIFLARALQYGNTKVRKAWMLPLSVFVAGFCYLMLFQQEVLFKIIFERLMKWSSNGDGIDLSGILSSRMPVIAWSWSEFMDNPLFGVGFGVERGSDFLAKSSLLSAPSEKSFWPTAILHEMGIAGGLTFLGLLFSLYRFGFVRRNFKYCLFLTSFLTFNLGEYNLFSFGGVGAFGWFLTLLLVLPQASTVPREPNVSNDILRAG